MTEMMDRFWIARGLDEREVTDLEWRGAAYGILSVLVVLNGVLAFATAANLVT